MPVNEQILLKEISEDRALGAAVCFSHRHPQQSPAMHVEIVDHWRAEDEFVLIEAFRQGGKTTLAEEFLTLEAEFGNFGYALVIGETYAKAIQRLDAIKAEISGNAALGRLFGRAKGVTWNENLIELKNGTVLQAAGWDQELRGFLHRGKRPDRAYLDDVENKSMVRDTPTVDANWRRFWTELVPALDKDRRKIRVTGTPLADDCMVKRMKADPTFVHASYPICDGDIDDPATRATWPERYPMEWIRAERDRYARAGTLREFLQEFMLVSAQTQGKPFTEDQLRFVDVAPAGWLPRKVIMDPARTVDVRRSDQTGRVVVSRLGTRIYVHESGGEFWRPDQIVDGCFRVSERHDGAEVVIEKNSLDEWLLQPLRAEQRLVLTN